MRPVAALTSGAQIAATLAVASLGGWVATLVGLPLPWMLGSLIAVTILAIGGISLAGRGVYVPRWMRNVMIPVIGVILGASFTPDVVGRMGGWWVTLLALLVFIVVSTLLIYQLYRRVFGFEPTTAYFAAVPGGLVEMAIIAESLGGDAAKVSLIHFCRIVLAVVAIPFVLQILEGPVDPVAALPGARHGGLDLPDIAILVGCAVVGYFGARAIRMPGAVIAGPLLASAAAHATGLTAASPPGSLITIAQVVIGAALGSGFASLSLAEFGKALRAAATASVVMMFVTVLLSLAMSLLVDEPLAALVLAYAPGGFAEMSLIALAVGAGIPFVAAHHIARIVLSVMVMPMAWRRLIAPRMKARNPVG